MHQVCDDCKIPFPKTCPQRKRYNAPVIRPSSRWCPVCNWRISADDKQTHARIENFRYEAGIYGYGNKKVCFDCELQVKCITAGIVHA